MAEGHPLLESYIVELLSAALGCSQELLDVYQGVPIRASNTLSTTI